MPDSASQILARLLNGDFVIDRLSPLGKAISYGGGHNLSVLRRDEGRSKYKPHQGRQEARRRVGLPKLGGV